MDCVCVCVCVCVFMRVWVFFLFTYHGGCWSHCFRYMKPLTHFTDMHDLLNFVKMSPNMIITLEYSELCHWISSLPGFVHYPKNTFIPFASSVRHSRKAREPSEQTSMKQPKSANVHLVNSTKVPRAATVANTVSCELGLGHALKGLFHGFHLRTTP